MVWARSTNLPCTRQNGLFGSEDPSPYQYVEVLDITGMDPFVADISTEEFQAMAAPFQEYADNPQFILTEDL